MIKSKLKVIPALALTGVLAFSFTSCSTSSATSTASAAKESKMEKKLSDILSVNAVVEKPSKTKYDTFNAILKPIDGKQLEEIFFKDEKNLERDMPTNDFNSIGSTGRYIHSETASLYFDKDRTDYRDKLYSELSLLMPDSRIISYKPMNEAFIKPEISSYSKSDAIAKVRDVSKTLGLNISKTPTVYALDSESLTKREKEVYPDKDYEDFLEYVKQLGGDVESKSRKRNFTVDDESYFITFELVQDDTGILSDYFPSKNDSGAISNPSRVMAIVGKNGFHFFEALRSYDTSIKTKNNEIIDVNKALETVVLEYEKGFMAKTAKDNKGTLSSEINNISLKYIANKDAKGSITLIPAWIFKLSETLSIVQGPTNQRDTFTTPACIVIDAVTGKEIK